MSNKITADEQEIYPTRIDLNTCVKEAQAILKDSDPNLVLAILMTYHNTLLKEIRDNEFPKEKRNPTPKLSLPYK